MQEPQDWTPPTGTLGAILAETRHRVAVLEAAGGHLADSLPLARPDGRRQRLSEALRRDHVAVIAEVKRRSPSRGVLNAGLSARDQALLFERAGAAAISVLTEPTRFGGSLDDLHDASAATRIPILKKDFHISPFQIAEVGEASGLLLIARALPPHELLRMLQLSSPLCEAVVEVRTESELETAIDAGARIVGVNARDLETLEVDESVPERLIPMVPSGVIAIWESGISTRADVKRAARAGADAVLVGSALSLADDPAALLAALATVPRRPRG